MRNLSLVQSLSRLQEEQKHSEEVVLDHFGLSLTRGTVVEISGGPSSGKTSAALSLLAKLTATGEVCAIVDSCGSFDPMTGTLAGVTLENLLWVRCGNDVEKSFMAADYLVQAKGFGAIWLNLCGLSKQTLRLVPKTYWYRYRTRIKETPTVMLVTAGEHVTGSASHGTFVFEREKTVWSGSGKFRLISEFQIKMRSHKQFFGEEYGARIGMDYSEV